MFQKFTTLNYLLLGALLLGTVSTNAQSFSWVKTAGGNDRYTTAEAIAIDHHHNEIVTGFLNDTAHFGSILTPFSGDIDGFVAKYDSLGNVLWVRTIWGTGRDKAYQSAIDTADNIYVVGEYGSGYVHFSATDSMAINAAGGNHNFFIAKYDKDGNFLWARNGGNPLSGTKAVSSNAVTVDPWGNAVIGGYYQDTMVVSGMHLGGGAQNLFLAKYSPSGTCTWAKAIRSNSHCVISAIACDDTGNIYPTGKMGGKLYVGTTEIASNSMGDAIFFGKFNPSGNFVWMDSLTNNESASTNAKMFHSGNGILVDHSGNVYLAGSLLDTAIIITTPSPGLDIKQHGFIAKYNNAGVLQWMQRFGDNKRCVVNGIAFDAAGGLYAAGNYKTPTTFGGISLLTPSVGYGTVFVGKFDPATGNALWIKTGGGYTSAFAEDRTAGIAIDQTTGSIAIAGNFYNKVTFDGITVSSPSTIFDFQDIFVTRQINPVTVTPPPSVGIPYTTDYAGYAIYPNPASSVLNINLNNASYHKVVIIDISGRILMQTETNRNTLQLDIQSLSAGTYTIAFIDARNNAFYSKIVKM